MFKDDRMMGMLTFVLVMVALGTMVQRSDFLSQLFGIAPVKLELRSDETIVPANELTAIDVLANDVGLGSGDADRLVIAEQPGCGRVFIREGKAHYLPAERCAGPQRFIYAITGRDESVGEVLAVVQLKDPMQNRPKAAAQRDVATPTPAGSRPAVTRDDAGLTVLTDQTGKSEAFNPAPRVPRPQTGQVAGLTQPRDAAGQSGGADVALDVTASAPHIAEPGDGLNAGTALPDTAALSVVPHDDREPATGAEAPTTGTGPGGLRGGGAGSGLGTAAGQDPAVARAAPAGIGAGSAAAEPGSQPIAALGGLLGPGGPAQLPQVSSSPPPSLGAPQPDSGAASGSPADGSAQPPVAALSPPAAPGATGPTGTDLPAPSARPAPAAPSAEPPASAGTPPPAAPAGPCTTPPALTLDIRPGGHTRILLDAPCDAGRVAEVSYDSIAFGIPLDGAGLGEIIVPGLQRSANAELRLPSGDGLAFDLPFTDIERIDRVALVWETPVQLDLHAFEFGALPGSDGHVWPGQPRSFGAARRHGGGYLLSYEPAGGVGQHITVYTYWRRPGDVTGVVKLKLDFASRSAGLIPEACGGGALAEPGYRVLRSRAGQVSPPGLRRLAPLDCGAVAQTERLIADAVDDMVIRQR